MTKEDEVTSVSTPKGIFGFLDVRRAKKEMKKNPVKVIELDDKFIIIKDGVTTPLGTVDTGDDEIIINQYWVDPLGMPHIIHTKDHIRSHRVFTETIIDDKDENKTHSRTIAIEKPEGVTSKEFQRFGKIKLLDELSELNLGQLYLGLAIGGIGGFLIAAFLEILAAMF